MEKYKIEPSQSKPNHWVVTDVENLIVVFFENHKFNETQEVTLLENYHLTATNAARIMREPLKV
jgi:hypothetical protein